jgi:hypothetical protein
MTEFPRNHNFQPGNKLGTRFVKGVSGNPGGRAKKLVEVSAAAREHTVEAIETLASIMRDKAATASARVNAAAILLERAWGKPAQTMTVKREGEYRDLTDDELIAIAAGAVEGEPFTNGGGDPSGTTDDPPIAD